MAEETLEQGQFGAAEEEAIISFILDFPDLATSTVEYITPDVMSSSAVKYIVGWIRNIHGKHGVIPSRRLLRNRITRHLTTSDPYEAILAIVDRKSDPREVPLIRETLKSWARHKQYGLLYNDEALAAYYARDYDKLDEIFMRAASINDSGYRGFWLFDEFESLLDPDNTIRYKTGWPRLDALLNSGGPSPGEVIVYAAATNVGKSVVLCNMAANAVVQGLDTLHVTFEMSARKTARRCLGALMEDVDLRTLHEQADHVRGRLTRIKGASKARLAIYEMNPGECSADTLRALITNLARTRGFRPKVVIADYLELMISRNRHYNKEDYVRQKHVSTEICGFAKSEQVLVHTATQLNRSSTDSTSADDVAGLNKMAESYGKSMPPDYVISLNQSYEEYTADPPQFRAYIAKNREGPKFVTINCHVNYNTMKVRESPI